MKKLPPFKCANPGCPARRNTPMVRGSKVCSKQCFEALAQLERAARCPVITCQECGKVGPARSPKSKFCSLECMRAQGNAKGKRPEWHWFEECPYDLGITGAQGLHGMSAQFNPMEHGI